MLMIWWYVDDMHSLTALEEWMVSGETGKTGQPALRLVEMERDCAWGFVTILHPRMVANHV